MSLVSYLVYLPSSPYPSSPRRTLVNDSLARPRSDSARRNRMQPSRINTSRSKRPPDPMHWLDRDLVRYVQSHYEATDATALVSFIEAYRIPPNALWYLQVEPEQLSLLTKEDLELQELVLDLAQSVRPAVSPSTPRPKRASQLLEDFHTASPPRPATPPPPPEPELEEAEAAPSVSDWALDDLPEEQEPFEPESSSHVREFEDSDLADTTLEGLGLDVGALHVQTQPPSHTQQGEDDLIRFDVEERVDDAGEAVDGGSADDAEDSTSANPAAEDGLGAPEDQPEDPSDQTHDVPTPDEDQPSATDQDAIGGASSEHLDEAAEIPPSTAENTAQEAHTGAQDDTLPPPEHAETSAALSSQDNTLDDETQNNPENTDVCEDTIDPRAGREDEPQTHEATSSEDIVHTTEPEAQATDDAAEAETPEAALTTETSEEQPAESADHVTSSEDPTASVEGAEADHVATKAEDAETSTSKDNWDDDSADGHDDEASRGADTASDKTGAQAQPESTEAHSTTEPEAQSGDVESSTSDPATGEEVGESPEGEDVLSPTSAETGKETGDIEETGKDAEETEDSSSAEQTTTSPAAEAASTSPTESAADAGAESSSSTTPSQDVDPEPEAESSTATGQEEEVKTTKESPETAFGTSSTTQTAVSPTSPLTSASSFGISGAASNPFSASLSPSFGTEKNPWKHVGYSFGGQSGLGDTALPPPTQDTEGAQTSYDASDSGAQSTPTTADAETKGPESGAGEQRQEGEDAPSSSSEDAENVTEDVSPSPKADEDEDEEGENKDGGEGKAEVEAEAEAEDGDMGESAVAEEVAAAMSSSCLEEGRQGDTTDQLVDVSTEDAGRSEQPGEQQRTAGDGAAGDQAEGGTTPEEASHDQGEDWVKVERGGEVGGEDAQAQVQSKPEAAKADDTGNGDGGEQGDNEDQSDKDDDEDDGDGGSEGEKPKAGTTNGSGGGGGAKGGKGGKRNKGGGGGKKGKGKARGKRR